MIYFNLKWLNLNLHIQKTGQRLQFWKQIGFFVHFWSKKHFLDFFQKAPFSAFLIFFWNSKDGPHILIEYWVKMNADSEFLVHFDIGPQFRGLAHENWDILADIRPIQALKPMFFIFFSPNSDSLLNFTISLNWKLI